MKKEHPLFVAFWETHWRKHARPTDGRKSARDTFNKHMKEGADPQDMVDGAAWFIRNLKDKAFIPLAATWLNRGAYEDMCTQERDYQRQRADAAENRRAMQQARTRKPETVQESNERCGREANSARRREISPKIKEMLAQMGVGGK